MYFDKISYLMKEKTNVMIFNGYILKRVLIYQYKLLMWLFLQYLVFFCINDINNYMYLKDSINTIG